MTDANEIARQARERFVRWVEWYMKAAADEPDEEISQEELARRLGVTAPTVSQWRKKGSTTYPSAKSLIRLFLLVSKMYPVQVDTLLFKDPPIRTRR